jgi:hypothetical protein
MATLELELLLYRLVLEVDLRPSLKVVHLHVYRFQLSLKLLRIQWHLSASTSAARSCHN